MFNLRVQAILTKFQQEHEIGYLSIFDLDSGEKLFSMEGLIQPSPQENLVEFIKSSINISDTMKLDAINIEGENSTFIKSLGNSVYLVLVIPPLDLNVSEVRFFLTNFSLNYQEQGELVN